MMSPYQKILFFVSAPFCQRDFKRYGMETFIKNGFDIYVWDLTLALYPQLKSHTPPDSIQWNKHVVFKHKKDVISALEFHRKNVFIINTIGYDGNTFSIYRAISKNGIPYSINSVSGPNMPAIFKLDKKMHFQRLLKIFNPKKLRSYIIQKTPIRYLNIKPANFVIAEGLKCNFKRPEVSKKTKVIRTHALDYDIYLDLGKNPIEHNKTIVFLDNYFIAHPDSLFSDEKIPVTANKYYESLQNLFDHIETKYNFKVIIAAHPRSQYTETKKLFGNREVIKGKTAELVQKTSGVIADCSSSITFAVLYQKPIVFFITDEIIQNSSSIYNYKSYNETLALTLGKKPINISKGINQNSEIDFSVDEEKYKSYINNYIKVFDSENLPFWQIVCNKLKSL